MENRKLKSKIQHDQGDEPAEKKSLNHFEKREFEKKEHELILYHEKIGNVSKSFNKTFRRNAITQNFIIHHNFGEFLDLFNFKKSIDKLYYNLMTPYISEFNNEDIFLVEINNPELNQRAFIPPTKIKNFDSQQFLNTVYTLAQSNEKFLLDGIFTIKVSIIEKIIGAGLKSPETISQYNRRKDSIIEIKNTDKSCGWRSIIIGKYLYDNKKHHQYQWKCLKNDKNNIQTIESERLAIECGYDIQTEVTIEIIQEIEKHLKDYQIILMDPKDGKQIYKGEDKGKEIYLEYYNNHFNPIYSIASYLNKSYYCKQCDVGTRNLSYHLSYCKYNCRSCWKFPKCIPSNTMSCIKCFREFGNQVCFNNHIQHVCGAKKKCKNCKTEYLKHKKEHKCHEYKCKKCSTFYKTLPHYCDIPVLEKSKIEKIDKLNKIIVSYDIESYVNEDNQHRPNLLIAMVTCDDCWDFEKKTKVDNCKICGQFYYEFFSTNCVEEFGNFIYFNLSKRAEENGSIIYVFGHNAKCYDSNFMIKDLFERNFKQKPQIIMNGLKLLKFEIGNIKFLDSLSIFNQPLSALPKIFDLEEEKGYFPHYFNLPENFDYIGSIPPIETFGIKYLKKGNAEKLIKWHENQKGEWDFKKELIKYCKSDVNILMQSLMTFRRLLMSITNIDPFSRCFTIASMIFEDFRANDLIEGTIGIPPINGYQPVKNNSMIGSIWLDTKQKEYTEEILREQKIGNYYVDGYIPSLRKVFEFLGCYWHGHNCMFNKIINNESYNKTMDKIEYLKSQNMEIETIWECKYIESTKYNVYFDERMDYYKKLIHNGPIRIRDAFLGGRVNNIVFTYEATKEEIIEYKDFTSLYPSVLWHNKFFLGHPKVIRDGQIENVEKYFGFIKCKVSAPTNLFIPVLPVRFEGKLYFPLCRSCLVEKRQHYCNHVKEKDKTFVGTWTTMEINVALSKGYKIVEVYEVLHYENTSYDLFKSIIGKWLKIKQEASGFPEWCDNEDKKIEYINNYKNKMGINLEYDKIKYNPGLRFIGKLLINSFYGKFGQRNNLVKTIVVNNYKDYYNLLDNSLIEVKGEILINNNNIIINYNYKDENDAYEGKNNVALAAFVTSYARLKLYDELNKIECSRQGRVLYFDTDSIIFSTKSGEYSPPIGDLLGEMTDELRDFGDGAKISRFVSIGPKNYSFEVTKPDNSKQTIIKAKGIHLNNATLGKINIDRMISMANYYSENTKNPEIYDFTVPQFGIIRDKNFNVFSKHYEKKYKAVSEKRRIINNKMTVPFGYKFFNLK